MTIEEIDKLESGAMVGFAGILSTETRSGKFIRRINDYLVEIDYGDHTEQNHKDNIYKI